MSKERVEALASNILECHDVKPSEVKALAVLALLALRKEREAAVVQPMMFIDGDISSDDADKLAKIIRGFNEEDERPLAKMARIIRENPHPTNECDMVKNKPAPAQPVAVPDGLKRAVDFYEQVKRENTPVETGAWKDAVQWVLDESCLAAMLAAPGKPVAAGWIACSERMPELDTRVLLYFPDYGGHIEDGCIGDEGDGHYHYFFDGDSLRHEPTHWMPLPEAPGKEG